MVVEGVTRLVNNEGGEELVMVGGAILERMNSKK